MINCQFTLKTLGKYASKGNHMFSARKFGKSSLKNNLSEQDLCDASVLRSILDLAAIPINYCNADRVFLFSNKAHSALHGLEPAQVIGKTIAEILGSAGDETIRPYYERALQGEHVEYELEIKYKIETRYIQCIYNPVVNKDGKVTGWVAVTNDMTERNRLENILKKNQQDLRIAKENAETANIAKSEFLANMSHELRTPLNAIVGLINILRLKQHPVEKQNEYLQVMQTSSKHLMDLIDALLEATKLEVGAVQFESIPFDLKEIVNDIISINDLQAKQKGIVLRIDNMPASHPTFVGDPLRLRQVLMNLVGNAIKFTEKGHVSIAVNHAQNMATNLWDIEISVQDTGVGIAEDNLKSIFNKFTQADSSINRQYGGTGLGLSISAMLIEAMGGAISVESVYGQGSRFTIKLSLPSTYNEITSSPQQANNSAYLANQTHPDFNILLVEDNPENILVATTLLEIYGYTFSVAHDGKDALAQLDNFQFDLVLMDVQMPEMDGFEVTRLLREREKQNNLPPITVIGMTAHALPADRVRCIEHGMDDYISKPFNPDDLDRLLKHFSNKQQAA